MITNSVVENSVPLELRILKYLQPRMHFSNQEKRRLYNLQKGYEGESKLYSIFKEKLPPRYIILTDLLLKENHTEFQIDLLLLGKDIVYLLEVKNYEGNYIVQNKNWYAVSSQNEIGNPLYQLKRTETLLRQFLKQHKVDFTVEPYLVFINRSFFLYQAILDDPIIFPAQIDHFIKKLQSISFNHIARQQKLATYLTEQQILNSPLQQLPNFHYKDLRKGIVCTFCGRFLNALNKANLICIPCAKKESMESAVCRSVIEFMTLFPNKKVTTSAIHDWCHVIESKKTIRRLLKKHLHQIGRKRAVHFVVKE